LEEMREAAEQEARVWRRVEARLRRILSFAVKELGIPPEQQVKYVASATEQEVLAGTVGTPESTEHVFCFLRTIEDLPDDASASNYRDLDSNGTPDLESQRRLQDLKGRLGQFPTRCYSVRWNQEAVVTGTASSPITLDHLESLTEDVFQALKGVILKQLDELESVGELDQEIAVHQRFGGDIARSFEGRRDLLEAIARHLRAGDNIPLAFYGESGSGKTALLAKAAVSARAAHGEAATVTRFIGVSPSSSNGTGLLRSLCAEIDRAYGVEGVEIPSGYRDLVGAFRERLALATWSKPLFLFLDGLDQLRTGDPARGLAWLPPRAPNHVRLVVSTLPGECFTALEEKLPGAYRTELGPYSTKDGETLLSRWLTGAGRRLADDQKQAVLDAFRRCPIPLYLKLAFEQARSWASYDDPRPLGSTMPDLINEVLDRLSTEAGHGEPLVACSLGSLAASKNGMGEEEMLEVLAGDPEVISDFRRRHPRSPEVQRLPPVIWSRLRFDLEPYLVEREADGTFLIGFFHRQIQETVRHRYLAGEQSAQRHGALAEFFLGQELVAVHEGRLSPNLRKLSELPYQQAHGGLWDQAEHTLTELDFLHAKARAVGSQPLIEDFDELVRLGHKGDPLESLREALQLSAHVVDGDPRQIAAQIVGRLRAFEGPGISALLERFERWGSVPWLCATAPSLVSPSSLRHTLPAEASVVSLIGHGRALADSADSSLNTWDLLTGTELLSWAGAAEGLTSMAATPDGSLVLVGTHEGHLRVWDAARGQPRLEAQGHGSAVRSVGVTGDGRLAVSTSEDGTLRVWDLEAGSALFGLSAGVPEGKGGPPNAPGSAQTIDSSERSSLFGPVAVAPDVPRAVFIQGGGTLRVWDLERGEERFRLAGHKGRITAVAITSDGSRAVSGSADRTVKIWDLDRGIEASTLAGSSGAVYSVAVSGDGYRIIAGSQDGRVFAWDHQESPKLPVMTGHRSPVNAVAVTGNELILSAADDGELRLWRLDTGEELWAERSYRTRWLSVAADAEGVTFASNSAEAGVVLWDLGRRASVGTLPVEAVAQSLAMSPNGKLLVVGTKAGLVDVWDLPDRKKIRALAGHKGPVLSVALSPTADRVVSGSADGAVKVWDLEVGECAHHFEGHEERVHAVAMAPNGRHVISGGGDKTVRIWDCWGLAPGVVCTGHTHPVNAVAATPDGKRALSGSWDGTLKVWDLARGEPKRTLTGHSGWVLTVAMAPNGRAVSASSDRTIRVWDLQKEPRILSGHGQAVRSVAVSADGRWVVSGSRSRSSSRGDLRVWDLDRRVDPDRGPGHQRRVTALAMTGTRVVSGSEDGTVKVWSLEEGRELCHLAAHAVSSSAESKFGYGKRVDSVGLTTDGRLAISGSWDGVVRVWDVHRPETATEVRKFTEHGEGVYAVTMSGNGGRAISASWDGTLRVWSPREGACLGVIPLSAGEVQIMAISEDGQRVMFSTGDGLFETWDLRRLLKISELRLPAAEGRALALDPDTSVVALGVGDSGLHVWDLTTRNSVRHLTGHDDEVTAAAISPLAHRCVSVSRDHSLRVWDLRTGHSIAAFTGEGPMSSCALAPAGTSAAAGEESGRVHLLRVIAQRM
jgi:WD40 repeat protein